MQRLTRTVSEDGAESNADSAGLKAAERLRDARCVPSD